MDLKMSPREHLDRKAEGIMKKSSDLGAPLLSSAAHSSSCRRRRRGPGSRSCRRRCVRWAPERTCKNRLGAAAGPGIPGALARTALPGLLVRTCGGRNSPPGGCTWLAWSFPVCVAQTFLLPGRSFLDTPIPAAGSLGSRTRGRLGLCFHIRRQPRTSQNADFSAFLVWTSHGKSSSLVMQS